MCLFDSRTIFFGNPFLSKNTILSTSLSNITFLSASLSIFLSAFSVERFLSAFLSTYLSAFFVEHFFECFFEHSRANSRYFGTLLRFHPQGAIQAHILPELQGNKYSSEGICKKVSIKTQNVQTHFSRAIATKDMILNQIYQVQTCENKEYWKDMARKEYSGPWLLMVLKYKTYQFQKKS